MDNAKLNSDYDLDFSLGYVPWATENEAIKQHLTTRLNIFCGEWFLDPDVGTPYRQYILGFKDKKISLDALKQVVLDTPDISNHLFNQSYEFDEKTRTLSYNFTCTTKYGNLEYNNSISI